MCGGNARPTEPVRQSFDRSRGASLDRLTVELVCLPKERSAQAALNEWIA